MGTKYLIWKDKDCQGVNPEWLFLSGKEFFDFIKSEQSRGRYFIKQPALDDDDDTIIIEGTKEQYLKAEIERKHHKYLMKQSTKYETVSVYTFEDEDNVSLYDKQATNERSVEEMIEIMIMTERLQEILRILSPEENKLLKLYYFSDDTTERSIADKMGIPRKTFAYQKEQVIDKIRKFFAQN